MTKRPERDAKEISLLYSMEFDPAYHNRKDQYACAKGGTTDAPNSLVFFVAMKLDADPLVKSFRFGKVRFPFWHPEHKAVINDRYDFDVTMQDGSRRLVYVTSERFLMTKIEEAKVEAAESHAGSVGAAFDFWSEPRIFGDDPAYMRSLVRYVMDKKYLEYADDHDVPPADAEGEASLGSDEGDDWFSDDHREAA